MRDNWKVCLRLYTPGARHVFIRPGKLGQESVANAKQLFYPFLPSINIQTLRIGDANPDLYLSDDKIQYISLDKSIKTGILAAQSNQPKLT